jgi:hypothetical protein
MSTAASFANPSIGVRRVMARRRKRDRVEERIYKTVWHILIAAVGVYELRNHKTKLSKVLACGLIAFHVDAAVSDALDKAPLSRRILDKLRPHHDSHTKSGT